MRFDPVPTRLSVIVKCYNEQANLDACLRSLLQATAGMDADIIVVDSLSTDRSMDIAARYPVRVMQVADRSDRRCGAVAQLGFQRARGDFILLMDGDMELLPGFLPAAIGAMMFEHRLAGVGGRLVEMSDGMEFRERQRRLNGRVACGPVKRITGCGLYRAAALRDLGYFMDRNLHCFEEFELGLRLRANGFHLWMLDRDCVRHHGHRDASLRLVVRRWRTKFFHGHGELLRAAWRRPYAMEAAQAYRVALIVVAWWVVVFALTLGTLLDPRLWVAGLGAALLPWAGLLARKRSFARVTHSFLVWQFSAAALVAGAMARRHAPTEPVPAVLIQEGPATGMAQLPDVSPNAPAMRRSSAAASAEPSAAIMLR